MQKEFLKKELQRIIKTALAEDGALDDVTSDLTISKNSVAAFKINAREKMVFCGRNVIEEVFSQLKKSAKFKNSKLEIRISAQDGDMLKAGKSIAQGKGDAKLILAAERTILNLIQHLSGISTLTKKFVTELNDKNTKILDTRKTLPGLRALVRQAVAAGGGQNHRFNLSDMVLIKDNHIAAAGGVKKAVEAAKKSARNLGIEVECDTVKQVAEALKSSPDVIMLDNMKISDIKKSIALINKKTLVEISGGVNLQNIKTLRGLGADFISIGALTHSARGVDIGLDIL